MADRHVADTIAAVATGAGVSGIVLIRVSGSRALAIVDRVFVSKSGKMLSAVPTHTVHYGWIKDGSHRVDEALVTVMRAPRSYTREHVVEIGCHGGTVPAQRILHLLLRAGARPTCPGEFTKRAFLNGRIDLAQAEAVADIISARTETAFAAGVSAAGGALSRRILRAREMVVDAASGLEARIDFPQEEGRDNAEKVAGCLRQAQQVLSELHAAALAGRMLREGMRVVICGRPNAGKSSLLNALLRQERSIVTAVPGTTRDAVEAFLDIRGIPVSITDTAGMLRARGAVEKKAVAVSVRHARQAHLILVVIDGSRPFTAQDRQFIRSLPARPAIGVINKSDLRMRADRTEIARLFSEVIVISARRRTNLAGLEDALYRFVFARAAGAREEEILVNARQAHLVGEALQCLRRAARNVTRGAGLEFLAQDCRDACRALDEVLGTAYTEDVIDRIFSRFCIGK